MQVWVGIGAGNLRDRAFFAVFGLPGQRLMIVFQQAAELGVVVPVKICVIVRAFFTGWRLALFTSPFSDKVLCTVD